MNRGEIWLVEFDESARPGEPAQVRPGVIVSSDRLNKTRLPTVVVVPLTTTRRDLPIHVEVDAAGLDEVSYAQTEEVSATSRTRLRHRLGALTPETMRAVDAELRSVLGL